MTKIELQRRIMAEWPQIRVAAARKGAAQAYFARLPETVHGIELLGSSIKVAKGEKQGVLTRILYLPPSSMSGVNVCPWATEDCAAVCLGDGAGQLSMSPARNARLWRMAILKGALPLFRALMSVEIDAHEARADRLGLIPAARLDGSSDLGLARRFARKHPSVTFYDYTKSERRARLASTLYPNWHQTFSFSGENLPAALRVLGAGGNVAVVFDTPKGEPLPTQWHGFPVLDGDETDIRFDDPPSHVVGLRFKAAADRPSKLERARPFVQRGRTLTTV